MTDASTFLTDFARGIAATAPRVEDDDSIERHCVLSRDPLGVFQGPQAQHEPSPPVRRPLQMIQSVIA